MMIHCIWVCDDPEPNFEGAWLSKAWDEYSVDDNRKGWQEDLALARKEHKHVRVCNVRVSELAVRALFEASDLNGEVVGEEVQ